MRVGPGRFPHSTQRLDKGLERQLRADEIDRAPEQHFEVVLARAARELLRKPRLSDASFPCDEDRCPRAHPNRLERQLELLKFVRASDERPHRANGHEAQYCAASATWEIGLEERGAER